MPSLTGRTVVLVLWLLGSAAIAQPSGLPQGAKDAIAAGDWPRVVELLGPEAGADAGEQVSYWYGVALYESGDPAGATAHLQRALKLSPESPLTARYLALCASATGDIQTAHELADRFPTDATIALEAGKASMQRYYQLSSRRDDPIIEMIRLRMAARKLFERSVALDGESAQARRWLAFALKESREWERALEHISYAIALEPMGWEVYALAGECYHELGMYEQAAEAYGLAAETAPRDRQADLWHARGEALRLSGGFRDAIDAYKRVLTIDNDRYDTRYRLGEVALIADDLPLAAWAFNEGRTVDGNIDSLAGAGRVQFELGNYEDAERLLQEAIDEADTKGLRPPGKWYHWLGRAQWEQGDLQEAKMNLYRGMGWGDDKSLIYAHWAFKACMETDNPHGAIVVCDRVADNGYPDVALNGLKTVMQTWPTPRMKDIKAGRRPHTTKAVGAMGRIAYHAKRFRTSVGIFTSTNRHRGRMVHPDAGWAFLAVNNPAAAEITFRDVIQYGPKKRRDWGLIGGACALLYQGKHDRALKALATIEHEELIPSRDTCLLWARSAAGDPAGRELADPFTLLGAVGWEVENRDGESALEIRAVIPGSALDTQDQLQVKPLDRLVSIDGNGIFYASSIQDIRGYPVREQMIEVEIARGPHVVTLELDLSKTLAGLPSAVPAVDTAEEDTD
jgi:tetratricopeptide (TPR) repeat protein